MWSYGSKLLRKPFKKYVLKPWRVALEKKFFNLTENNMEREHSNSITSSAVPWYLALVQWTLYSPFHDTPHSISTSSLTSPPILRPALPQHFTRFMYPPLNSKNWFAKAITWTQTAQPQYEISLPSPRAPGFCLCRCSCGSHAWKVNKLISRYDASRVSY